MESPSEDDIANYRSWRRKLRRRVPIPWGIIVLAAVAIIPLLIRNVVILSWIWRDYPQFQPLAGYVGLALLLNALFIAVLHIAYSCFNFWFRPYYAASQGSGASRKSTSLAPLINNFLIGSLTIIAVLTNHIHFAVVGFFLAGAVSSFEKVLRFKQRTSAIHGIISVATAGAAVMATPITATLLWALNDFLPVLWRSPIREAAAKKPTRQAFVERAYQHRPPNPGLMPMTLFDDLCKAQMWDEALAELEHKKSVKRRRTNLRWHRARAYLGAGRIDEVIALNQDTDAADSPLAVFLAVAYARRGRHELALLVAQAAVNRGDKDAELCMAEVYRQMGDLPRALLWYEKAEISTTRTECYRGAGKTLMDMNDPTEAKYPLWHAVWFGSWLNADDLMQLAQCYRQLGKKRAAAEAEQIAQEQIALEQLRVAPPTSTHTTVPA